MFLGSVRSLDPSTETSLDPSLNGTGCHRKQDPSGDSHLQYGRQFVPALDRRGAQRGLALFFLCTLLAYLCYLLGVVTVSVPGRCLSVLPAESTWWQWKALRWWREERAKETRKVLHFCEGAGLPVKEERRELWEELSLSKHGALLSMCWLCTASWAAAKGDGGAARLARPRSPMTGLAHCRRTHPLGCHSKKSWLGLTVLEAEVGFLLHVAASALLSQSCGCGVCPCG